MEKGRPQFAQTFPREPALDSLVAAFSRGNFAEVRRDAPALMVSQAASDEVKAAAAELLERTRPDPLSYLFFGLTAALLVVLSVYWWWQTGRAAG